MSGLEVAGVVLAVIPLFISAIEHYEGGLRPFRLLKLLVYREELKHYRTKLTVEYGLYTNAFEELLVDVVSEQKLRNMIANGHGPAWKDPALDVRLRKRLGHVYDTYLLVMEQMQGVMVKIALLLDIQRQGNISRPQLEHLLLAHPPKPNSSQTTSHFSVYEFKKRLKFGFRSKQIQPLLDELTRYNSAIYQFTESSRRLEGLRSAVPASTFTTPIHHVRDCAARLHRCLGGAWTCSLHMNHSIDLQLEARVSKLNLVDDDIEDRVVFSVAFLDNAQPTHWHCLEIHVLTGDAQTVSKATAKVNFLRNTPASSIDLSTLPAISCLCASVSVSRAHLRRGLCLDHKQRLLEGYPVLHTGTNGQLNRNGSSTSLEAVLLASSAATGRKPFSSKQAYVLGLTVASSFLQLRATPWLCGSWRARNVLLIKDTTDRVDFERPYIRQTYSSCHQQPAQPQISANADDADDNCSFLNLGIMLLEIFFREPLSARQLQTDIGPHQSFSDLQTSCFFLYCLFCDPNVDLRDTNFRQMVVEQVIVPLKEELKRWDA